MKFFLVEETFPIFEVFHDFFRVGFDNDRLAFRVKIPSVLKWKPPKILLNSVFEMFRVQKSMSNCRFCIGQFVSDKTKFVQTREVFVSLVVSLILVLLAVSQQIAVIPYDSYVLAK